MPRIQGRLPQNEWSRVRRGVNAGGYYTTDSVIYRGRPYASAEAVAQNEIDEQREQVRPSVQRGQRAIAIALLTSKNPPNDFPTPPVIPPPGPPPPPPFSPIDIAGLSLWASADYGAYVDAGVTLATDGQSVQQWNDQSINLFNFINTGAAGFRPILKTGIVNGKNVIRFDGTDDYIQSLFTIVQPNTIFLAFNDISGPGGGDGGFIIADTTGGINRQIVYNYPLVAFPAGNLSLTANGGASNVGFPITFPTGFMVLTVVANGVSSVMRRDGVQLATGNAGTLDLTGITLGAAYNGTVNTAIDVAEIIVYNVLLTPTELGQVEVYLQTKYSI